MYTSLHIYTFNRSCRLHVDHVPFYPHPVEITARFELLVGSLAKKP
jgi:hypothetical protein